MVDGCRYKLCYAAAISKVVVGEKPIHDYAVSALYLLH